MIFLLQVFNVNLSFQELGSDGIPHLVAHCLQFVETYGKLLSDEKEQIRKVTEPCCALFKNCDWMRGVLVVFDWFRGKAI
jgi:hypothetical protein